MQAQKENFRLQQWVVLVAVLLFGIKIFAWYITRSVSILTDALESTVNVISGFIGLYSLYIASKPRDMDHPYGHGKAEFISAAVEGTLIMIAGLIIIYECIDNFIHPHILQKLDYGMILVGIAGLVNFIMGYIAIRRGKKNNSLALVASGKHLQSDTYSTIGILVGIALIYFTKIQLIDNIVALIFSFIIIFTGYKILRASLAGIMDEADNELLQQMIKRLNTDRPANWIDLHNLRVIKYGAILHIDCHLTVPWYLNVHEAHKEIDTLSQRIRQEFGDSIELFVHSDGCLEFSCAICTKKDCKVRMHPFEKQIEWTVGNILSDQKHQLPQPGEVLPKTA
ncbi:cation diffusion facilitator family transporter [Flavihumibacter profundi]|jgi:cation diffusion facilitator family transporter|uniref:cation diffusion facilitator family transporter n=1 Tax=Flavihumibacter profundi TaxID=2716883 RepID=UPI001CC38FB9|nr:cation diffusion facilitator family transporter [Flavihumibacter profundi]MBZ5859501.1 cation diffusion facilitator family transporter [Flavihumibacter profundi]